MKWIIEHIEGILTVIAVITFTGIVSASIASFIMGKIMNSSPSMLHENEPQGPTEWKPAGWKPLNENKTGAISDAGVSHQETNP